MRPIEKKVLDKMGENAFSLENITEIVDSTPTPEMKKSFPDDCHFQSPRYFAKVIADSLVRQRLVILENGKYQKPKKEEKKKDE